MGEMGCGPVPAQTSGTSDLRTNKEGVCTGVIIYHLIESINPRWVKLLSCRCKFRLPVSERVCVM